jgi:hypothetical protein
VALPLPLVADDTVSQAAEEVTLQVQLARFDVKARVPVAAAEVTEREEGASEYVQAAASWVRVNVFPATVRVAERISPLFAATL